MEKENKKIIKNIKIDKEQIKQTAKKEKEKAKKAMDEFKAFAFKGNIIDMSVGVVIGSAFTKIVTSLVNEIITPALSILTNKIDFNNLFFAMDGKQYATIEEATNAGVATINYGTFITNIIDFLLVAIVVFLFLKFIVNKIREAEKAKAPKEEKKVTTKICEYCKSEIAIDATRCPHCTSILEEKEKNN